MKRAPSKGNRRGGADDDDDGVFAVEFSQDNLFERAGNAPPLTNAGKAPIVGARAHRAEGRGRVAPQCSASALAGTFAGCCDGVGIWWPRADTPRCIFLLSQPRRAHEECEREEEQDAQQTEVGRHGGLSVKNNCCAGASEAATAVSEEGCSQHEEVVCLLLGTW